MGTFKRPRARRRVRWILMTSFAIGTVGASMAGSAAPTSIALPDPKLFPESIDSTRDGTMFFGSIGAGGVYRLRKGSAPAEVFVKPGALGSRSVFGILVDQRRGSLWACSADLSKAGIPGPGNAQGSRILAFDLKTGGERLSVDLPMDAMCNDMALGPDRSLYITDSAKPRIFKLTEGSSFVQLWVTDPQFDTNGGGLDGIVFDGSNRAYVDTFSGGGLYRIDINNGVAGHVTKLRASLPLVMPDALRRGFDGKLLLVEGGGRLDDVKVSGEIATIRPIAGGLAGPTGVAVWGRAAWVTEGQLSFLFNPAKKGLSPSLPFKIAVIPIR